MISDLTRQMIRIRAVELEIARRYPEGKMRTPVHLSIGQEAPAVGVCSALGPNDLVVSTHRSHAHYLAKGGDLNALIAELYGKSTGCSGGYGGSMHLTDVSCGFIGSTSIVAQTIPVGVGLAFSKKLKGEPGRVVIFFGDAAVEEGVFWESLNFAILHNLPVLFVCENNGYSCYTEWNERRPHYSPFEHHGITSIYKCRALPNVEDIFRKTTFIFDSKEPAFLEIRTTRQFEHCGVTRELEQDELDQLPVPTDIQDEIKKAFELAESDPFPDQNEIGNFEYA